MGEHLSPPPLAPVWRAPCSQVESALRTPCSAFDGAFRGHRGLLAKPQCLESSAVPAKKRLGSDDPQHVPPGRCDGCDRDQKDSVEPRHARPDDRTLKYRDLVSEQGDPGEQRPTRAKETSDGAGEDERNSNMGASAR